MIAISKRILSLAFLATFIFAFTACDKTPIQANSLDPMPQFDPVEDGPGCEQIGEMYTFQELIAVPGTPEGASIPTGAEYRIYFGSTIPYSLADDCVCRFSFVRLEFDWLPVSTAEFSLEDAYGDAVDYDGPMLYNGIPVIVVNEQYLVDNMYFDYTGPVQDPPLLQKAGGYCIVDNISGPREPAPITGIYSEDAWDDILQIPYKAHFAPLTYTTGMVP